MAAHGLGGAGELEHGLHGDLVDVVAVGVALHAGDVHQGVGGRHRGVLDELHLSVNRGRYPVTEPLASHGLRQNMLANLPI